MAARTIGRITLAAFMVFAGIGHLTFARAEFQAQVPEFIPLPPDVTVLASGAVEIALGAALILVTNRRALVGVLLALFFVAVFPGNIAQYTGHRDAFGLDTDAKRLARLPFQAVLIAGALWSTAAWRDRRRILQRVDPRT